MNESEFFYWLQGYFELAACTSPAALRLVLSQMQADCILKHIDLVEAQAAKDTRLSGRLYEIRSLARVLRSLDSDAEVSRARLTREIENIVASQFQHVIDPQAGDAEQQAKLNEIHGPQIGGTGPNGVVYRC